VLLRLGKWGLAHALAMAGQVLRRCNANANLEVSEDEIAKACPLVVEHPTESPSDHAGDPWTVLHEVNPNSGPHPHVDTQSERQVLLCVVQ
jgi:hypothetical protein